MLKHKFFRNFSAAPLSAFFALGKRISTPGLDPKVVAFIKNVVEARDVALPRRKVKTA